MNIIIFIFFFYIFIGLYMTSLLFFIYIRNRKNIFDYPRAKTEGVSIVIPCYNASKEIGETLDSLFKLNYPKELLEIIVVDDKSTDNSIEIVEKYSKKYSNIKLIKSEVNSGGAAIPRNIGIKSAKYDYVAVMDDDSMPEPDILLKMLGFLQNDSKVAAVTSAVMAKSPNTFMSKLQAIEYAVIAWNRKLLDLVDSVYVTPGPFALYKKKILLEVGLFDPKNMTEDIEIVWRLLSKGYCSRMSLSARVYSKTPQKLRAWWRQRVRWNMGGTQTLWKYKSLVFRKGMLGAFIIPFFSFSLFLGLLGLLIFVYLIMRKLLLKYLFTKYSLYAGTTILRLQDLSFNPTVLNYFGIVMFVVGLIYTIMGLVIMDEWKLEHRNVLNILFYMLVYLSLYPSIMVNGLYRLWRRKLSWY